MSGKSWPLVTDEQDEFEKLQIEVQVFEKFIDEFQRIWENIPLIDERKTERCEHETGWTWKHLDLDQLSPKTSLDTAWDILNLWFVCIDDTLHLVTI